MPRYPRASFISPFAPGARRARPGKVFLTAAIAIAAVSALLGFSHAGAIAKPSGGGGNDRPKSAAVAAVTREDLARQIQIAAQFEPYQDVDVHAQVAGYVKVISVDIGDRVTKGQVLAVLEVPEIREDLARAKAAVARYRAEIVHDRSQIRRYEALARQADLTHRRLSSVNRESPNLVAQQDIDVAFAQAQASLAQAAAAQANLAAAQQQLAEAEAEERRVRELVNFSRIVAPFNGIVTKRYVDTGSLVQKGTASHTQAIPVVRVAQVDQLRLSFPVPETNMARVQAGTPVTVAVPSLDKTFDARVWRYSASSDDATRTMETQVLVENPKFELKPGMLASVALALEHRDDALTVPLEAVSGNKTNPTVWVVTPSKRIEERKVELGLETPTKYEVLSGLSENEQVIVAGRDRLKVGEMVEPKRVAF